MAGRANWKGHLKIAELSCAVALHTAVSTADRIAFHTLNRATGNRVHRAFVDEATGKPVAREDQVKGYEVSDGEYLILEPDEVAAAVPDSDKTLSVLGFVACADIDDVYFDKQYYLAPADKIALETFVLLRDGLLTNKVAAVARTVLFRRVRTLLIQPHHAGLRATTLNFDYEVRSAEAEFRDLAKHKIDAEMLDLAKHIIETKKGSFDPSAFHDRYESALADLVKAKRDGRKLPKRKPVKPTKANDLMDALRMSAANTSKPDAQTPRKRKAS